MPPLVARSKQAAMALGLHRETALRTMTEVDAEIGRRVWHHVAFLEKAKTLACTAAAAPITSEEQRRPSGSGNMRGHHKTKTPVREPNQQRQRKESQYETASAPKQLLTPLSQMWSMTRENVSPTAYSRPPSPGNVGRSRRLPEELPNDWLDLIEIGKEIRIYDRLD
ncbi:hypothetical protein PG994_008243 [Apiospora phragmitis]|uniref:Uncharacterized protein n=1 Tax=Apiospora phragmitis TaxID=2905665 RepID=A0ABR1USG9_9PEZI